MRNLMKRSHSTSAFNTPEHPATFGFRFRLCQNSAGAPGTGISLGLAQTQATQLGNGKSLAFKIPMAMKRVRRTQHKILTNRNLFPKDFFAKFSKSRIQTARELELSSFGQNTPLREIKLAKNENTVVNSACRYRDFLEVTFKKKTVSERRTEHNDENEHHEHTQNH